MKISLNKTYLTTDGIEFSPVKNKLGKNIGRMENMLGMPTGQMKRGEMIFIDKNGNERKRSELKKEIKKTESIKLPKFVRLDNSELRLVGNEYYRDAGKWSVGYKVVDNKLYSVLKGMPSVDNKLLVEITEKEWRKGNGVYVRLVKP